MGARESPGGGLTPLAATALRQARAGTQGAAPTGGGGVPLPAATGPSQQLNELAAIAAANFQNELEEEPGSELVPSEYCYPYILMAGAWGRRATCPAEWRYLSSSDGPPTRSQNGKGDAIVSDSSTIGDGPAIDRACPNGDPVSRRKAAAYREEQRKKVEKEEADKENKKRAKDEAENKRKGLEVLQAATTGMTNVATSLAKVAAIKEAEHESSKRRKKIDALKTKLELKIGDEAKIRQQIKDLLDEECSM